MTAIERAAYYIWDTRPQSAEDIAAIIERELEKAERPWRFNSDGTPNDDFSDGVTECRKLMGLGGGE